MAELIQDLNVVVNHVNFRTLHNQIEENSTKYDNMAKKNTNKGETGRIWDDYNEGKLLSELTTEERDLLFNDASGNTDPPLRNLVRTHNPVSYVSQHPQTGISLGKLDRTGRSLDEYIRIMISDTTTPRARDGSYLEILIASWVYSHNFLIKDPRTGLTPVETHLGMWRAANITSLNKCIEEAPRLNRNSTVGKMQEMLQKAYKRKKVYDNINEAANKQKRKQLQEKGTVLQLEDIANKCPPLTMVILKTDLTRSKVERRSPNVRPYLVISHRNGNVNLMELKTGKILRRSYRNIQKLLPSDEI